MAIMYHPVAFRSPVCDCEWSTTNSGIVHINNKCCLHGETVAAQSFRDYMFKEAQHKGEVEQVNNALLLKHQKYVFMGERKDVTLDVVVEKRYTPIARFR